MKKTKSIYIRISPSEKQELIVKCKRENLSISEFIRIKISENDKG